VVGILFARRGSGAPGICPVFLQKDRAAAGKCRARLRKNLPRRLSKASILGRASSTSVPLSFGPHPKGERELEEALNHAAHRGIITVAAAGNQGMVGSSAFTSHVWVISVAACDIQRRPLSESNLTRSIGRRGLSAPGENIISLGTNGKAADIWRDKRRRALRDWRNRAALVGVSRSHGSLDQARRDTSWHCKVGSDRSASARWTHATVAEDVGQTSQRWFLPAPDLGRVESEHLRDLWRRLMRLDGLHGHLAEFSVWHFGIPVI
jgi:hypothetical protein